MIDNFIIEQRRAVIIAGNVMFVVTSMRCKMVRLFNSGCKTREEKLEILKKAHLNLPVIDYDYMPDDLVEARRNLEKLMLKYIWQ